LFDPAGRRIDRLEETLDIFPRLFRGETVLHAGITYELDGFDLSAVPNLSGKPPIAVGAGGPRMLRLAVRYADIVGLLPAPIRGHGSPVVVLAACPNPSVGRALVADTAAVVGVVGPALEAGTAQHRVRVEATPVDSSGDADTVLAVVGSHTTVALCIRPGAGAAVDFVLTHDPDWCTRWLGCCCGGWIPRRRGCILLVVHHGPAVPRRPTKAGEE
jgi:alkanesulfonate monooxygenase SsuD/methylene tetrahydromethanopterin reductase-like flavin-dependent oxidoreductase (luciferase family)